MYFCWYIFSLYVCIHVAMYVCLCVYLIYDDLAIAVFCLLFCRLCIFAIEHLGIESRVHEKLRIPLASV